MTGFDLDGFLPYQLAVTASTISRAFARRYQAEFGLSIAEWRVMSHLSQADSVSVRDIQVKVDLEKSKVSRAAARLEAAGLITKVQNVEDRRLVSLSMTESGRSTMKRLAAIAETYQNELMTELGPDRDGLVLGLERLRKRDS